MTEKKYKDPLLLSLLALLLREWGYDTVRQCLAEAQAEQAKNDRPPVVYTRKPAKANRRRSAVEMVERLDDAPDRKESLHVLAARFDAKTFLPSGSDVRHFLKMRGYDLGPVKHRQGAFSKVLEVLLSVTDDELVLLQAPGTNAGPTRLGPLSDAIKATSAAVRNTESRTVPTAAEGSFEPPAKPAGGGSAKS